MTGGWIVWGAQGQKNSSTEMKASKGKLRPHNEEESANSRACWTAKGPLQGRGLGPHFLGHLKPGGTKHSRKRGGEPACPAGESQDDRPARVRSL
jgi:hypothetical protein